MSPRNRSKAPSPATASPSSETHLIIGRKTTGESEVARLLRVKTVGCQSRAFREAARHEVSALIRTSHQFEAVLDFDRAVRDPANPRQINPAYDVGDHLHMNPAGDGGMAASLLRTLEAHVCRC
jgi:hypothetical protein